MKKQTLLPLLLIAVFTSCKKDSKNMDFSVSGLKDTTYQYQKISEKVSVKFTSGEKTNVSLSASGQPKGLEIRFSTASGTPDFETNVELSHSEYIAAGSYPVKINAKAGDATKSAEFNITIKEACGTYFSGNYNTDVTYASSGELLNNTQYTVTVMDDNPNRVYFYEGKNKELDFYADVNCGTSMITIPAQTKSGTFLKYSGSGTLNKQTGKIEFTILYEGFTELKFTMNKQ